MEIDNEQLRRLKAAGWECSWQFHTEIRIGGSADIRQFTVRAEKDHECVVVVSARAEQSKAWEHLYMEANRVDPQLQDEQRKQ